LRIISGAAASAVFLGNSCPEKKGKGSRPRIYEPRRRIPNPYITPDGKPILVSLKGKEFSRMLEVGLDILGGLSKLITNNRDVLIKPNLFESSEYPWISSKGSIVAIIEEVQKATVGAINVGDMSFEETANVYSHLDLESVVSHSGGSLLMFSNTYKVRRDTWDAYKPDFEVYSDVYNAPVIINTPVLKRHMLAGLTCALKNNVGAIKGSGASSTRNYIHSQSPSFPAEIAEVAGLINPELNIVDARSIVTQIGPFYEQQGPKAEADTIVICGDMVATDAYCARLMEKYDPSFSESQIRETLDRAELLGLGLSDLNEVEILEAVI
jgi:uncharacterized protein (DUF362 family)